MSVSTADAELMLAVSLCATLAGTLGPRFVCLRFAPSAALQRHVVGAVVRLTFTMMACRLASHQHTQALSS
jgi:hypothetical protein